MHGPDPVATISRPAATMGSKVSFTITIQLLGGYNWLIWIENKLEIRCRNKARHPAFTVDYKRKS